MNAQEKAKFDELSAKVSELENSVNTEQDQVTALNAQKDATIASLNQTIIDLQAIIDNGNPDNTAEIQSVIDKVQTVITDLETTV